MVSVFFSQWYSPILLVLISLLACTVSQLNANVHLKSKHSLNLFELDWERLPLEIFLPPESSISTSHDGFDGEGGQNEETNIESFFDFSSFASIFSSSSVSSSFQNSNNSNNKGSSYDTISNFINDFSSFASSMFSSNPNYSRNTFKSSTSLLRSPKSRKLQTKGSNCILIERGTVPRYYDCNGCVIDRAQACIDDLRGNKSHNVYPDCHFKAASVRYLGSCCPKVELINERYNLQYISAAYPMALRCLEEVHCSDSTLYLQLEKECMTTCPQNDPRTGGNVCHAQFNAAFSLSGYSFVSYVTIFVAITTILILY